MTETATRSILVEREMPHPPEKIWRALTTPALIEDWLMANDFAPELGRRFQFRATPVPGWSGITNCEVTELDPPRRLAYAWGDGSEEPSWGTPAQTAALSAELAQEAKSSAEMGVSERR